MMKNANILVYAGRGVSPKSYRETLRMCRYWPVRSVFADTLNGGEYWERDTHLLIMPGGCATPYYEDLSQGGIQRIKDFVAAGGNYLGICAGGYFGASRIIFEKGHVKHEIVTDNALGMYASTAEGPAYGLGCFEYNSEAGARQALITDQKNTWPVYFNGGCWFHESADTSDVTVLARYADLDNQPAAVIAFSYGKGKVCLSGVHFEYRFNDTNQDKRNCFIQQLMQGFYSLHCEKSLARRLATIIS